METNRIENADSFEFGTASKRIKLHFWSIGELEGKIKMIKEFLEKEEVKVLVDGMNSK